MQDLETRWQRARQRASAAGLQFFVRKVGPCEYRVPASDGANTYTVKTNMEGTPTFCGCPGWQNAQICKHAGAVAEVTALEYRPPHEAELIIIDDGGPLDAEAVENFLASMRETTA